MITDHADAHLKHPKGHQENMFEGEDDTSSYPHARLIIKWYGPFNQRIGTRTHMVDQNCLITCTGIVALRAQFETIFLTIPSHTLPRAKSRPTFSPLLTSCVWPSVAHLV